jgi:hypothetical protein
MRLSIDGVCTKLLTLTKGQQPPYGLRCAPSAKGGSFARRGLPASATSTHRPLPLPETKDRRRSRRQHRRRAESGSNAACCPCSSPNYRSLRFTAQRRRGFWRSLRRALLARHRPAFSKQRAPAFHPHHHTFSSEDLLRQRNRTILYAGLLPFPGLQRQQSDNQHPPVAILGNCKEGRPPRRNWAPRPC